MGKVWMISMPPTNKAVLISLADQANDNGLCWPSLKNICARTCLSERAVQKALGDLEVTGILRRVFRTGHSTHYHVTPAGYAPPQDVHPASTAPTPAAGAPPPPQDVHLTPAAGAPRTVIEPSIEPSRNRQPVETGFFEFWSHYPSKKAKDDALKAWMKLKPNAELREVIAKAVAAQSQWPQWTDQKGKYIPHAATWLNRKRWQDEAPDTAAASSGDYQRLMTDVAAGAV